VGKSDRAIIKIEVPAKNMTITRTFRPKTVKASPRTIEPDGYLSKDVFFKSKGAELSGTLTFPVKEGKYPAILLAPGAGPQDRDYQGLFASLADYISKSGLVCLRFDKRGVGSSGGELSSSTGSDEVGDLEAALQCLKGQNMADPSNIVLIGHASGSIHAMKIAVKDNSVKGLIMMAPSIYTNLDERSKREELQRMSQKTKWTDDYLNLVIRTAQETQNKVTGSNGGWVYILGKKCFLGDMKDDIADKPPVDITGNLDLAFLILQGKDTDDLSSEAGPALDKIIADAGNNRHTLTYYAYLGQFLGQKITDGAHRQYYDTDKEVLENIRNWLKSVLQLS
jgi:alpha/beta superfamily hydrolase